MAEEKAVLMYKGHPLMRKDNLIYYGSMADSHIIMLQILESKMVGDSEVASKVSIQLQLTDPSARSRDRIVKKSEKMVCILPWIWAIFGWSVHLQASNFPRSAFL